MEETLQRVFSVIIAVVIFFLLPLYIAFEKKDDISYSLALKITTNFVDNVKTKGYITKDMYDKYISRLAVTGNAYDIQMEHLAKKYNPVIYAYDSNKYEKVVKKFDYNMYKTEYEKDGQITDSSGLYKNLVLAYELYEQKYTDKQILETLDLKEPVITRISASSGSILSYKNVNIANIPIVSGIYRTDDNKALYPMSKGDEFTIILRNTNTTIATVLFNTLTFGANTGNDTKIYINYGSTIQNEEYRKNIID